MVLLLPGEIIQHRGGELRDISESFFSATCIRRPSEANGIGRISTALTTLKMTVFAPIVSAIVSTAVAVKTGDLRNMRTAYRKSAGSMSLQTLALSNRIVSDAR